MIESPILLIQKQLEALFTFNSDQRLLFVNEPWNNQSRPAPLIFIGRTVDGTICRFRHDIPKDLCNELESLVEQATEDPLAEAPVLIKTVRHRFEMAGWEIDRIWEGPAFCFSSTKPVINDCLLIDSTNVDLLRKHFDDIIEEIETCQPMVAIIEDGHAVSVCRSVRLSPHAVEAGINTDEAYRRRGLAFKVVSHWAALVQGMNIIPLYSTSWKNVASRALAKKLGLVQYGTDLHFSGAVKKLPR